MFCHGSIAISGRKHCVLVNGVHSESIIIQSDVPQGLVLGVSFLIYINDLTKLHHLQLSRLTLYTDDIQNKPISSDTSNTTRQQLSLPLI